MGTLTCPVTFEGNLLTNGKAQELSQDPSDAQSFVGMIYREISTKKLRVRLASGWKYLEGNRHNNYAGNVPCLTSGHYSNKPHYPVYTIPPATGRDARVNLTIRRVPMHATGDWIQHASNLTEPTGGWVTMLDNGEWKLIDYTDNPVAPEDLGHDFEYEIKVEIAAIPGAGGSIEWKLGDELGIEISSGMFMKTNLENNYNSDYHAIIPRSPTLPDRKVWIRAAGSDGQVVMTNAQGTSSYKSPKATFHHRGLGVVDGSVVLAEPTDTLEGVPWNMMSTTENLPSRSFTLIEKGAGEWLVIDRNSLYSNVNNTPAMEKEPSLAMRTVLDAIPHPDAFMRRATFSALPQVGKDRMFYLTMDDAKLWTWDPVAEAYEVISRRRRDEYAITHFDSMADNTLTTGEVGQFYSYSEEGMLQTWDEDTQDFRGFYKDQHTMLYHNAPTDYTTHTTVRKGALVVESLIAPFELTFTHRSDHESYTKIVWRPDVETITLDVVVTRVDNSVENVGEVIFYKEWRRSEHEDYYGVVLQAGDLIEYKHRDIAEERGTRIRLDICAECQPGSFDEDKHHRLQQRPRGI